MKKYIIKLGLVLLIVLELMLNKAVNDALKELDGIGKRRD